MRNNKDLKKILKEFFEYEDFRKPQEEIIRTILDKKSCIGILPTGSGKSLCFQLPSIFFKKMTIVISPLVALMKDQVEVLNERGIRTACLNSHLTPKQMRETIETIKELKYQVLYLAPEKLFSEDFKEVFLSLPIDHIAVDEAHCISSWGHDFRPKYKKLGKALKEHPDHPVISAFTATANQRVIEDIAKLLFLEDPVIFQTSFDRPNLIINMELYREKTKWLLKYLKEQTGCGIVYVSTRSDGEKLAQKINKEGLSAACYHAGLPKKTRNLVQSGFFNNEYQVLIATNAFGMGLDKGDLEFIVHYSMPANMESYYQEIGRGGRDGRTCQCTLLFGPRDVQIQNSLSGTRVYQKWRKKEKLEWIEDMVKFVHSKNCYKVELLAHFGEESEPCGLCQNCQKDFQTVDKTRDSQKILSAAYRLQGNYSIATLINVLRGKKLKIQGSEQLEELSVYGIMKGSTERDLRLLVMDLVFKEYLTITREEKELVALSNEGARVLKSKEKIKFNH